MVVVAVVKAARLTWAGNVCWFFDVAKERKLEEPQRALERNLCQLLPWGLFLFLPALTIFHKKCKRGLPSRLKARRQRIIAHVVREMKIQVVHRFSKKIWIIWTEKNVVPQSCRFCSAEVLFREKKPDRMEIFRDEEIFPLKPVLLHCIELIQFVMSVSTRLHRQTFWNGNISPLKLVTSKKSA